MSESTPEEDEDANMLRDFLVVRFARSHGLTLALSMVFICTFVMSVTSGKAGAQIQTIKTGVSSRAKPGEGSTLSAWKKTYKVDVGPYHPLDGCHENYPCYGADVHNGYSQDSYQFVSVEFVAEKRIGLVADSYTQNFPDHTTLAQAESDILQTLPKDATLSSVTVENDPNTGSCGIASFSSPTVGKELGTPKKSHSKLGKLFPLIADRKGIIGVEFTGVTGDFATGSLYYNPSDIQVAFIQAGLFDLSKGC
jgi:hypothetical protein